MTFVPSMFVIPKREDLSEPKDEGMMSVNANKSVLVCRRGSVLNKV